MLVNKNEDLIKEFRDYIKIPDVKLAFDELIDGARNHPSLDCHPREMKKGETRSFRFYADENEFPFSFITNRGSLLFYLRRPALRSGDYPLSSIEESFEHVDENTKGEITIKVFNREQARLVVSKILRSWQ